MKIHLPDKYQNDPHLVVLTGLFSRQNEDIQKIFITLLLQTINQDDYKEDTLSFIKSMSKGEKKNLIKDIIDII